MTILDRPRLIGLGIADRWRQVKRKLRSGSVASVKLSGSAPERILLAPQDLRTADPTLAQEFYAGIFTFAGRTVETHGDSPFAIRAPSAEWERQLHGFGWLRHFGATNTTLAQSNAQALVRDWINANAKSRPGNPWDIEIASRRLISWLCHSLVLVENADHAFYRLLMRSFAQHIRFLRVHSVDAPDGYPRLICRIALAYAAACLSDQKIILRRAYKNLDLELQEQILPDGGHISRNIATNLEVLADLLPLRQATIKNGQSTSEELMRAIERMYPAIRMFRHSDGTIARFNGVSYISQDLITTLLRYDETFAGTLKNASHSGYQRIDALDSVVIMDTGEAAIGDASTQCHAGCLSFEMSSGKSCIIVNCGVPTLKRPGDNQVWRASAAHSTAILNNTSSCRFQITGTSSSALEGRVISGLRKVGCERNFSDEGEQVVAFHDGYTREFGIRHQRSLTLSKDGTSLMGCDQFNDSSGNPAKYSTKDEVVIRFHLHPNVAVTDVGSKTGLFLNSNGGGIWRFSCIDAPIVVEDSIFFASSFGAQRTSQIVLNLNASSTPEVRWIFEKQS